jgi:hypothetical protein
MHQGECGNWGGNEGTGEDMYKRGIREQMRRCIKGE